jgi:polar amino acid transport system substrate-binding protein
MRAMTSPITPAVRAELAPTGTLRVGLNYGNFLLVLKDAASGEPRGIAPDLARELGRRVGVPVEFVRFDQAGKMADAVTTGVWDVAFLAAEPARADVIAFTAAYLEIEATYLVPAGSPIRTIAEVDRPGVRIAVANKAAYDLYLSRTLKHAELVRAEGIDGSYELFVAQKLDVLSGLKPRLLMDVEKLPGARILDGRFTAIQQGIGTPKARAAAAAYLSAFVEEAKSTGLVAQAIARHGVRGVNVAPAAAR